MSLASRISVFFLAALALVLAGFSGTLYLLARSDMARQLDAQLEGALDILEASVDIEPGGLEWEPTDRQITLGVDPGIHAVRWAVRDGQGALIDRSANSRAGGFPIAWAPRGWPADPPDGSAFGAASGWRMASRRLRIDELLRQGRGHPDDEPGFEVQYPTLILVVGLEPAQAEATLGRLGLALAGLSAGIWASAAAAGRWFCRRALMPVSRMAHAATAMTAADLGQLPVPSTGDELEELGRAFNGLLDRLTEAFSRLNEAYDRQRRFALDASHQLRTPLAALLGQVQVARRHDRSPEEYRRVLDLVGSEGARLRQIVESLLAMVQPGTSHEDAATFDLGAWARDHAMRWSSHHRSADLAIDVADAPLMVRASPTLVGQVLDNLLENAFKYSPPGSPVAVRAWREPGAVALGVEDRGPGISAEDQPRVFEPFFRTERARREGQGGVGLGLAVAHRIAASLGGSLELRSDPGGGSRFVLRLPEAAADAGGEAPGPRQSGRPDDDGIAGRNASGGHAGIKPGEIV
ncbi:sensor histidine kinase [Tundrisphaera sp. TA3]|uniref:sensor histidine kinase n=1 Tax=Tundrisphaera sp. TA3 TaxID=3435775 RepID=UPI003EC05C85